MNKHITKVFYALILMTSLSCSENFLNQPAKGALGTSQLLSQAGVEQVLIGAYSDIKGSQVAESAIGSYAVSPMNWVFGGVVGQEAFKGSNSGDQSDINPLSQFQAPATNSYIAANWGSFYDGVNRANSTLKLLKQLPSTSITKANATRIRNEARFLRGYFHLSAKMFWGNIPYVDETIDYSLGNYKISNTEDAWPKIIADFTSAYDSLPETAPAVGRANKWAAAAFLAKCYMYQKDFTSALPLLRTIVANGKTAGGTAYDLNAKYRDAFDAGNDNSKESVFACQASVNDGSGAANANADQVLNFPYLSSEPVGCCGFYQPSLDQANSYRTDAHGMPYLDGTFNTHPLADELAFGGTGQQDNGNLDPRIDWTIGRQGVPFFDWGNYSNTWVRSFGDGGPYTPKKVTFPKTEIGTYTDNSSWTPGYSAVNYNIIRFADVLLWTAEAEVEVGSLTNAEVLVNRVRARVAVPATWVKVSLDPTKSDWQAYLDPSISSKPAGTYVIGMYDHTNADPFIGAFANQTSARQAVHMERKLELGMEGHRFFDLVRWGETNTGVNSLKTAITYNGSHVSLSNGVVFTVGKNEVFPIPQAQIDLNGGVLKQNSGY
jgi:hypothetical protein